MDARTLARVFVVGLALAAPALARAAEAPPPAAGLAVALLGPERAPYEGEVLTLELQLTWDPAWLEAHGVPFARRPMDLPLRVQASALAPSARLVQVPSPAPVEDAAPSFALGDDVVTDARPAAAAVPGLRRAVLRRAFQVWGAGPLALEAPSVDVTWAERFTSGLLGERIAVAPRRATLEGAPLTLDVRALPADGRPAGFEGLIGSYALVADAAATSEPGLLGVVLTLRGVGNHGVLPAPRLAPPPGWTQVGRLEERTGDGWRLSLSLASPRDPSSGPLRFATHAFDPAAGAYVEVAVTLALAAPPADAPPTPPPPPAAPPQDGGDARPWALALLLVVGVAWLALRSLKRTARERRGAGGDPGREARRAARARLVELAGTPAAGPALLDALSLHLGVSEAALVDADLPRRLEAAGLDAVLARDVGEAVRAWVASRYAGPGSAPAPVTRAVAERLAAGLAAQEAP